ncbi:MAG: family 43 glycosylhydrolase, partial [Flavisolibacter sp.]
MKKNFDKLFVLLVTIVLCSDSTTAQVKAKAQKFSDYLFVYFTGNQKVEEAIRFAISTDGYHYRALNNNNPVLSSAEISSTGGVRDPHILRGADGNT